MKTYKSIEDCPAWNYDKANQDKRYLIKGIDYDSMPDVNNKEIEKLIILHDKLVNETTQYEIDSVKESGIAFELMRKIEVMEAEYKYVTALLNFLQVKENDPYIKDLLKQSGYSFSDKLTADENIKKIRNKNENYRIKINAKRDELKAITSGRKQTEKPEPIEKVLIHVEKHFGRDIDLKTISQKKWLTMKHTVADYVNKMSKKK